MQPSSHGDLDSDNEDENPRKKRNSLFGMQMLEGVKSTVKGTGNLVGAGISGTATVMGATVKGTGNLVGAGISGGLSGSAAIVKGVGSGSAAIVKGTGSVVKGTATVMGAGMKTAGDALKFSTHHSKDHNKGVDASKELTVEVDGSASLGTSATEATNKKTNSKKDDNASGELTVDEKKERQQRRRRKSNDGDRVKRMDSGSRVSNRREGREGRRSLRQSINNTTTAQQQSSQQQQQAPADGDGIIKTLRERHGARGSRSHDDAEAAPKQRRPRGSRHTRSIDPEDVDKSSNNNTARPRRGSHRSLDPSPVPPDSSSRPSRRSSNHQESEDRERRPRRSSRNSRGGLGSGSTHSPNERVPRRNRSSQNIAELANNNKNNNNEDDERSRHRSRSSSSNNIADLANNKEQQSKSLSPAPNQDRVPRRNRSSQNIADLAKNIEDNNKASSKSNSSLDNTNKLSRNNSVACSDPNKEKGKEVKRTATGTSMRIQRVSSGNSRDAMVNSHSRVVRRNRSSSSTGLAMMQKVASAEGQGGGEPERGVRRNNSTSMANLRGSLTGGSSHAPTERGVRRNNSTSMASLRSSLTGGSCHGTTARSKNARQISSRGIKNEPLDVAKLFAPNLGVAKKDDNGITSAMEKPSLTRASSHGNARSKIKKDDNNTNPLEATSLARASSSGNPRSKIATSSTLAAQRQISARVLQNEPLDVSKLIISSSSAAAKKDNATTNPVEAKKEPTDLMRVLGPLAPSLKREVSKSSLMMLDDDSDSDSDYSESESEDEKDTSNKMERSPSNPSVSSIGSMGSASSRSHSPKPKRRSTKTEVRDGGDRRSKNRRQSSKRSVNSSLKKQSSYRSVNSSSLKKQSSNRSMKSSLKKQSSNRSMKSSLSPKSPKKEEIVEEDNAADEASVVEDETEASENKDEVPAIPETISVSKQATRGSKSHVSAGNTHETSLSTAEEDPLDDVTPIPTPEEQRFWKCVCGEVNEKVFKFCGMCRASQLWTCSDCDFELNKCRFQYCGACASPKRVAISSILAHL